MIDVSSLAEDHPLPQNLVPGDLGIRTKKDTGQRPWYDLLFREVLKNTPWIYSEIAFYRAWVSGEAYENKQLDGDCSLFLIVDPADASEEPDIVVAGEIFRRSHRTILSWTNPNRLTIPAGPPRIYWSFSV